MLTSLRSLLTVLNSQALIDISLCVDKIQELKEKFVQPIQLLFILAI
jgi:hypothetical protein